MWKHVIPRLGADFLAHDPAELNWPSGIRNGLGIVLPLAWGLVWHQVPTAVVMSVGAIVTGFAGLAGTWQKRLRVMLAAILWVSITAFVGGVTGQFAALASLAVVLSGGIAGMFVAVMPELATIGTLATAALIVFSGLALPAQDAGGIALKVLAGGTLQLLLMLAVVPWQPQSDGTASLRRVLSELAQFSRHPARDVDLRVARALVVAEDRIADRAIPPAKRWRLATLLRRLDAVRNDIVALHMAARMNGVDGVALLGGLSDALKTLGRRISTDPEASAMGEEWVTPLRMHEARLDEAMRARWHHLVDLLAMLGDPRVDVDADVGSDTWRFPNVGSLFRTMRANLSLQSSAFRHALRIMGALAGALVLEHVLRLPRGYWVPLTTLVILKADFFSTVGRGVARVIGTALGVMLATAIVGASGGGVAWALAAMVVLALAMYTLLNFNYTLFSVMVTGEIVLLLSFFEKVAPLTAMQDRLEATLLGSGLALGAFLLFPTWQRATVPQTFARLMEAEARYVNAMAEGETPSAARRDTRLIRTQAAASLDAAMNEPARAVFDRTAAVRLMQDLHRLADVLMSLEWLSDAERSLARAPLSHGGQRLAAMASRLEGTMGRTARPAAEGEESPGLPWSVKAMEEILADMESIVDMVVSNRVV